MLAISASAAAGRTLIIIILLFACSVNGYGQLHQYRTRALRLIYIGGTYSYMVPHFARTFENAMRFHKNFWNYSPSEPVTILLNDFTDNGNAGTLTIPWNYITVGIAPFEYTFDVMPANERMQWLNNHELTHTVMTDKASDGDLFFRKAFSGKVMPEPINPLSMAYSYLTTPRWYSPRWFHEGIAVFMETWMSGGLGRVLGGYDEMVFRTMVRDSIYFYRPVGLETEGTTIDFQVGVNAYLYGTRFVGYLANNYGFDKVKQFYTRTNESSRFYAPQFEKIFGSTVEDEWEKWISFENRFQTNNLNLIRNHPVTEIKKITPAPLGSVSKSFFDSDARKLYAAVNYPGRLSHICSINIDDGKMEKLADVESAGLYYVTSLAYDDSAKVLFTSTSNNNWRGLEAIDIKTGSRQTLIDYARAGDLAFSRKDKSLWGVQTSAGRTSIIRIPPPYNEWMDLYTIPFGQSFFDTDISSDGKYLSGTISDAAGRQKLIRFSTDSLEAGITNYEELYEFEDNAASNFVFSRSGRYMYGTSYYSGASNVYRIDTETKKAEILTNCETGLFRPLEITEDSLVVYEYLQNGLRPGIIKVMPADDVNAVEYLGQKIIEKNPELESYMLQPPSKIKIDSVKIFEGDYSEINEFKLAYLYPSAEGYKSFVSFGAYMKFMDPTGIHSLGLKFSYSPNTLLARNERLHAELNYNYWDFSFSAAYNPTDFYDLFGPLKISRKGYSYSAGLNRILIFNKPYHFSYKLKASAYGDLETLPEYQNVSAAFDKLYAVNANLNYSYLRKSLGAVEDEAGYDWNLYFNNNHVNGISYPGIYTKLDAGILLPFRNTSLWLRTAAGHYFGSRDNPFSNFYFGGFGNNYIDHLSAHRYRETESLPGFKINEIGGKNFIKAVSELNLAAVRFRKLGFLSFYSTYFRLSLFCGGLAANIDNNSWRKTYYTAGAQLDFELVLFSLLKSTLSFGYGRGAAALRHSSDEFMISLKII